MQTSMQEQVEVESINDLFDLVHEIRKVHELALRAAKLESDSAVVRRIENDRRGFVNGVGRMLVNSGSEHDISEALDCLRIVQKVDRGQLASEDMLRKVGSLVDNVRYGLRELAHRA